MSHTSALVGRNVRHHRLVRGMTIDGLSQQLSAWGHPIHPDSLSRMETGKRRVTVDDLVALAIVLDVKTKHLLRERF